MFRKILCATDFSPGSDHAMRVAIRLANESGADLVLAHAWYVPPLALAGESPFSGAMLDETVAADEKALEAARKSALELGAKRVSTLFLGGPPWEQLCDAVATDAGIDLVVVGTHGRTGLRRVLLGSVAEKVVRHSPCSVLAVRGDREGVHGFRHVLCPVDFSSGTPFALELASRLAARDGQGLTLFHALDVPVRFAGDLPNDLCAALDRRAAEQLEMLAGELGTSTTLPVAISTRIGTPAAQALLVLESTVSYDLTVVGSHGRTGVPRILLGSVAEKIVRLAPCPVLVARRRAGA